MNKERDDRTRAKDPFFSKRNIALLFVILIAPIVWIMFGIWLETRHPDVLGGDTKFDIDSQLLNYVVLFVFFSWPSLLSICFLEASIKTKLAFLFMFIVLWGPVIYVTLIISAIFIGGAYP